ncbi:MAG: Maf family protein [Verrucomicrobiota bacterium]|nr:Maf family protein [Verrucomicrobiota bacterium]
MQRRLILASVSPRRRELLRAAGFEFDVVSAAVTETESTALTLREITLANALRKGRAVSSANRASVVVAADTLVALDGLVLGKPTDLEHARHTLRRLSGRTHEVCSGVFVGHAGRVRLFQVVSRVRFRVLTDAAIADYFTKVNPLDKAGAYAAQGNGADIIQSIDGSFTNVVGLPMDETIRALAEFGIQPTSIVSRSAGALV